MIITILLYHRNLLSKIGSNFCVLRIAYLGKPDRGFTHTDFNKRISIIGISDFSSKEELLDTITHEVKHLVSHICKYYNINEDSEDASYLTGYVIKKMYKVFKHYLCN